MCWGSSGANAITTLSPIEAEAGSIFENNLLVGGSMFFLGAITGGVYGCIVLLVNGYLVGELVQYLFASNMHFNLVTGLLPHIGLEIAGLICFAVPGFIPVCELVCWMKNGSMSKPLKSIVRTVCVLFVLGTVSLLAASLIEGTISVVK